MAAIGGDLEVAAAVIGTAVTASALAAAWWNRKQAKQRTEWRRQDRAEGWEDDGGQWHVGAIDLVLGYTDKEGRYHDGLATRMTHLEDLAHDHPDGATATKTRRTR